jgi:hypothetical protein
MPEEQEQEHEQEQDSARTHVVGINENALAHLSASRQSFRNL